jgi:hypothetical protein
MFTAKALGMFKEGVDWTSIPLERLIFNDWNKPLTTEVYYEAREHGSLAVDAGFTSRDFAPISFEPPTEA